MRLDDPRQRLVAYAATLCLLDGRDDARAHKIVEAAWGALTDEEQAAVAERWGDLVSPDQNA